MFTYWHDHGLQPISDFITHWKAEFEDFRVISDDDVYSILSGFPDRCADIYRHIRIPACRADIARLLAIYAFGGLYVDCHCSIVDPWALRRLTCGAASKIVLLRRGPLAVPTPRSGWTVLLNSFIAAPPRSALILAILQSALGNLEQQYDAEVEAGGYVPYKIWSMTGPGNISSVVLDPSWASVKPEYSDAVEIVDEAVLIRRYIFYDYRRPGMHWSERQTRETLFDLG